MAPAVTLHFVYNVEATPQALVKDFVHRLVDPATYPCRLCDVTYGRFVKKPRWQLFLWSLPVKTASHTKDWFLAKHPQLEGHRFPAVFTEHDGRFTVFMSAEDFQQISTLEELEAAVRERLEQAAPAAPGRE